MTASARFSIIIPVHNGGEYLRQAVQSVLDQTCSDWHLVILENGSDDGTAQWLETLSDPRVTVYAVKQTLSIEANWKRILDVSCGEFLTLLGHDDLLDSWYLEEMERLIATEPEAALYQTQFRLIDAAGNTMRPALSQPAREMAPQFLQARLQRQRESFGTGYMMRWRDYVSVGGIPHFSGLIFADDALWLQLMSLSFKATSPRECFAYRAHATSSSVLASWEVHLTAIEQYLAFLRPLTLQDEAIEQTLQEHRSYFVWHIHYAYLIALTQATKQNRRIDPAAVNRFNVLLASIDPCWTLKTNRGPDVRSREFINHFGWARRLYNFYHRLRYGS